MTDCPIYWINPNSSSGCSLSPADETVACSGCNCGYIQFENLLPYLPELNLKYKENIDSFHELEFKLRQQIIEVSRLFDIEADVPSGYFSKAHYKTSKVFRSNNTKFLKIPDFVDSVEVRTMDNQILDPNSYRYENQHLVYLPCKQHEACGCSTGCTNKRYVNPRPWPDTCYQITAKWGHECSPYAVQMAVRDFLIEHYRMGDPIKILASGISAERTFRLPYSWSTFIESFKKKRGFFSQFAVA